MSQETAALVANLIAGTLFAVWLVAAWFVRGSRGAPAPREEPVQGGLDDLGGAGRPAGAIAGSSSLRAGSVDEARKQIEKTFRSAAVAAILRSPIGVRAAATGDRLEFTGVGTGEIHLERGRDGGIVAHWWLESRGAAQLMTTAYVLLALGLLAIVTARYFAEYAVQAETAGYRNFAIQAVQAVHLVWPPFLFAGLARVRRSQLKTALEVAFDQADVDA